MGCRRLPYERASRVIVCHSTFNSQKREILRWTKTTNKYKYLYTLCLQNGLFLHACKF